VGTRLLLIRENYDIILYDAQQKRSLAKVRPKLDGKDCWEKLTFIYLQDQIPMLLGDVEECIKLLRQ
ncbi:unnamed protein product, partial [Rotaria sp. Silwood1]